MLLCRVNSTQPFPLFGEDSAYVELTLRKGSFWGSLQLRSGVCRLTYKWKVAPL